MSGRTLGESIGGAEVLDHEVIRPVSEPYSRSGGLAVLKGSLAPDGAVLKEAAMGEKMRAFTGAPRAFLIPRTRR